VNGRLSDSSRVHAIVSPLSLCGPALNVRKFAPVPFTPEQLVRGGTLGPRALAFLAACVRGRANLVVSGGTGSGKTTLLGVLSAFIPDDDRVITIEDAAELRLTKPHVLGLEELPIRRRASPRPTQPDKRRTPDSPINRHKDRRRRRVHGLRPLSLAICSPVTWQTESSHSNRRLAALSKVGHPSGYGVMRG
jgi:hypothetical protein